MIPPLKYTYNKTEALSICRLVWSLIVADNNVTAAEMDYFKALLGSLYLSEDALEKDTSVSNEKAFETIRKMPSQKRLECATLLRLAVTSDGKVEKPELAELNAILEKAAIFRVDPSKDKRQSEGGF